MSEADSYEQRIRAIQLANEPILEGFQSWLEQSGLTSPETVDDILFMLKDSRNEFLRKVAE